MTNLTVCYNSVALSADVGVDWVAIPYPRVIVQNVRVVFTVTCGKCGKKEVIDRQVDVDLAQIATGMHLDDSLRRAVIAAAWPAGWATESYRYDESGGPGGYAERTLCPECMVKRQTTSG